MKSEGQPLGSGSLRRGVQPETILTPTEKTFMLYAERGDIAGVRRLLEEFNGAPEELNINCVDSLGRSALISAIENENIDLIRLLLEWKIKVQDALLHAIKEEYVEAVELLLEWEEKNHVEGRPHSWEAVDRASATFTPDITPLVLAAHVNNYEIVKILLDRGATLPSPHNVRCGCHDCIASSETDSLRHSRARINAYKALTASSLIALSSEDPLLTAFELSRELRSLSHCEAEFREEYNEMRAATQDFATALLNHVRTYAELTEVLNFSEKGDVWVAGERQTLERLKLAIKYKQKKVKKFVAHPNVQQLLASIWYDGLPGFRRKSTLRQAADVLRLVCLFPLYSCVYLVAPRSRMGLFMKKPFVKFIFHSSSYMFFLTLLSLASQRAEHLLMEWLGNEWLRETVREWRRTERGPWPGAVEVALFVYTASLIYGEVRELWTGGLREYVADLWNIVDFITNCFYLTWIFLRFTAIYIVKREHRLGRNPYVPREEWDPFDPILVSEGAFAAAMILSFLKLVHIFSVNPYLGPLQISLGRMILDILKFFFIYTLVLFAFGCGLNQLMWYYADLEKSKCYGPLGPDVPDFDGHEKSCTVWRRFANLFETSQSLFWASFGLVDLTSFDLAGIKSFTRFWGLLLFGCYSVVNIIVLLNMLIAMLSNSYQIISERSDVEWKFARSRLWMSYFVEGDTLPPPFNLLPTVKTLLKVFGVGKRHEEGSVKVRSRMKARERHKAVVRNLVARYVMAEQRKRDEYGITEDDVIEIRHDISTLRYELMNMFSSNGMKTPEMRTEDGNLVSKKVKIMERRLVKDFHIGAVEGIAWEATDRGGATKGAFAKAAKLLRRASRPSCRKVWNAAASETNGGKTPMGTAEERRQSQTRRSSRRYTLGKSFSDPDNLVEHNTDSSTFTELADKLEVAEKENLGRKEEDFGCVKGSGSVEAASPSGGDPTTPKEKESDERIGEKFIALTAAAIRSSKSSPECLQLQENLRCSVEERSLEGHNVLQPSHAEEKPEHGIKCKEPLKAAEASTNENERQSPEAAETKSKELGKPGGRSKVTGEMVSGWI